MTNEFIVLPEENEDEEETPALPQEEMTLQDCYLYGFITAEDGLNICFGEVV